MRGTFREEVEDIGEIWESGGWEIKSNKEMYEAVWERGPRSLALK